jgi:hypothetical protein
MKFKSNQSGLTYKQVGKSGNDLVFATNNPDDEVCILSTNELYELLVLRYWKVIK